MVWVNSQCLHPGFDTLGRFRAIRWHFVALGSAWHRRLQCASAGASASMAAQSAVDGDGRVATGEATQLMQLEMEPGLI